MAGEINWFPRHPRRFVVSGSEIKLYEVPEPADDDAPKVKTPEEFHIHTEKSHRFAKCIDPSYSDTECVVAVGLTTGKFVAINFDAPSRTIEFTPRNPKTLNCMRWKGTEARVAIGFDRSKSEECVNLWDTDRNSIFAAFGGSDSAISMCWDPQFRCLWVGVASKAIKCFDPRMSYKEAMTYATKSVQGVEMVLGGGAVDGNFFSSYSDNLINYFDVRALDHPVTQITTPKNVIKTGWSRGKQRLGVLVADSPYLHLYDLHCLANSAEIYYVSKRFLPFGVERTAVMGLSWHAQEPDRVACLSTAGTISDYRLQSDLKVQFDNKTNFMVIHGKDLREIRNQIKIKGREMEISYLDEISEIMQKRALQDYGQIADIQQNGEVAQSPKLAEVWKILASMYSKGCMLGLKSILGVSSTVDGAMSTRSEIQYMDWYDFPSFTPLKTYRSEPRQLSQALCGWNFERNSDGSFNYYLETLCDAHEYTKAALIACFHLKLKQAVDVLTRSGDNVLRITAIAIGSFNADRNFLRSDMTNLYSEITDPYLRAIFAFLSQVDDHWEGILNERKLPLADKMAFACMYLSDTQLSDYIKRQITFCIETGDLSGILLTGATGDGVTLLQSYLDTSEDVQTVALIASRFFTQEHFSNSKIQFWIATYRDLLDAWKFWQQRAQFDIMMGNKNIPPKSVYLLCNFCGKSVSSALQEDNRVRTNNRLLSCPHCRKPLPRCSLCLLHMGTTTSTAIQGATRRANNTFQAKPFANWYAWCQTCRHGGHTEHLNEWFAQYSECPVTSCDCNCYQLDQPSSTPTTKNV